MESILHVKVILNNIFIIVSLKKEHVQPNANQYYILFKKNSGEFEAAGKEKKSLNTFKKHLMEVFSFLLKRKIYSFALKLENVQSFFFRNLKKILLKKKFRQLKPVSYFFYNTVTFNGCRSSKKIRVKRKRYKAWLK